MVYIMLEAFSHRSSIKIKGLKNNLSVGTFLFKLGGEDGKRKSKNVNYHTKRIYDIIFVCKNSFAGLTSTT